MKLLAVVTPPPDIYHGCSTWKMFWEEKFTMVNMKSCGRQNVRNHNGEQYIILDISSKLDFMENREVTSSESKYYMEVQVKELTTSLDISTKISEK